MTYQMQNLTRGQLIDRIEEKGQFVIRSIENWNNTQLQSFTLVIDCTNHSNGGFWAPIDKDSFEMFILRFGWGIHDVLWTAGTCACITLKPINPIKTMSAGVSLLKGV